MIEARLWWRETRYCPTDIVLEGETMDDIYAQYDELDFCEVEVDFDHPDTADGEFILT